MKIVQFLSIFIKNRVQEFETTEIFITFDRDIVLCKFIENSAKRQLR